MEATGVSLARSVLDGVLSSAGSAVADEVARLLGVPKEVEFIRSELEMMHSFLKVASAHPEAVGRNDTVRTWVKQVRDLAYDVEDCLLDFALYAARASSSRAGSWLPGAIAERHRVAARIRDLKARVEELNQRNLRYHVAVNPAAVAEEARAAADPAYADGAITRYRRNLAHPTVSRLAASALDWVIRPWAQRLLPAVAGGRGRGAGSSAFQAESDIVGRRGEKAELTRMISGRHGPLRVVAVWGMGGMGKSSLARMVHNDPDLLDEFDCDAWVTVPHPLDGADVFARRLRKGLGLARGQDVHEYLREKRYLVVVDDLQGPEEWRHARAVLFDNGKGSRIVVTTRREDVAKHCASRRDDRVYELKPLGDVESMDLLCQKVYKTTEYTLTEDMAYQARHILKRCWGLPLAISTIGSLLANRPKTSIEWSKLHEHLGAELESDRNIREVIVSSYDGLPYDLKLIFLYLSIFPENHEIRCTRLLRRWMAEGYIAKKRGMPLEDSGERFYNELISRSMIQPSKKKLIPGERVGCRVHSMMLQIILPISIEENQLFLIEKQSNEVPQSKIRHLVVSRWKRQDNKLKNINLSYVRSLTIFGECPASLISPKMQLLRVLDMEDTTNLKNDDLKHVGELHHLRYLSLRGTDISKLPSSLQNLRCLETLDIQDTQVTQLPDGVVKLEKLCYLLAGANFTKDLLQRMAESRTDNRNANFSGNTASYLLCNQIDCCKVSRVDRFSVRAPEGIEKLKNLHMLRVVNVGQGHDVAGRFKKLTNLTNLQRLGVAGLAEEEGQELCKLIGKLNRLQRLEVRSDSLKFLTRLDESVIPRHLVSLRLCGNLTRLPAWISSLNNLAKVKLLGTHLEQGDILRLEKSPNLALLSLWENSYIGKSLRFRTGTFPKLKFLDIDGLEKIEKVIIKKDAMPELEQLWVNKCESIRDDDSGLSGVPYLLNLNELVLKKCGEKKNLIDILQEQVNKHSRRPKFLIGKSILLASQMSTSTTEQ